MKQPSFYLLRACCQGISSCTGFFYHVMTSKTLSKIQEHIHQYFTKVNQKTKEYLFHWIILKNDDDISIKYPLSFADFKEKYLGYVHSAQDRFIHRFESMKIAKEICLDIVENAVSIERQLEISYRRCTFVKMGECRICKRYNREQEVYQVSPKNYEGIVAKFGWMTCIECMDYAEIRNFYNEVIDDHLYFDKCRCFWDNGPYNFWRISSNSLIKPYLQKKVFLTIENGDLFFIENNSRRIHVTVTWADKDDPSQYWHKRIPLVNFIFHNRQIHGYKIEDFPILQKKNNINSHPYWRKKWIPKIKYEYNLANKINTWLLSINRLGNQGIIPVDLSREMIKDSKGIFWRNLFN